MVRAFELPFAPATGITDLGGSVCQGGVRCPVTDLCVVCVRRYTTPQAWERAGFFRSLAILGAQRRGQRLSAATASWVDDALLWLGDEEESCFSEGATLPAEDTALLDVAFHYLGIGTIWGRPLPQGVQRVCESLGASALALHRRGLAPPPMQRA